MTATLKTERLTLRPFTLADAGTVRRLAGNWEVARMLTQVPHPYPDGLAEQWIADEEADRAAGRGFHFGLELTGEVVGAISLEQDEAPGEFELGYWLGEPWWGRGLMSEAARAIVAFGFETLGARQLTSHHFLDNPASKRILEKCGFRPAGHEESWSLARDCAVTTQRMVQLREDAGFTAMAS